MSYNLNPFSGFAQIHNDCLDYCIANAPAPNEANYDSWAESIGLFF